MKTSAADYLHLLLFNDTATTENYTLSLHDALPISSPWAIAWGSILMARIWPRPSAVAATIPPPAVQVTVCWARSAPSRRSEEHTSELQSRVDLVCRLLLAKKKKHEQLPSKQMTEKR